MTRYAANRCAGTSRLLRWNFCHGACIDRALRMLRRNADYFQFLQFNLNQWRPITAQNGRRSTVPEVSLEA